MDKFDLYRDIATRTGGEVYVGVVGPVRTGKSTLIKRIMEQLVIPEIDDPYRRERARDELPQSGSGRTIMTSEPKFVPEEAVGELEKNYEVVSLMREGESVRARIVTDCYRESYTAEPGTPRLEDLYLYHYGME